MTISEQLVEAKQAIGTARRLLAHPTPDSLWEAAQQLEQAVARMRMMAASLGQPEEARNAASLPNQFPIDEFQTFRKEVRMIGALLGQLGGYFAARSAATYSSNGQFDLLAISREPRELLRA